MNFLINLVLNAAIISILAYILPGVTVENFGVAMLAALVISLVGAIIGPILGILTLPVNVLTLGLFTFVLIAFLIQISDALVPGLNVEGFFPALIFGLLISLVSIPFGKKHHIA